jgi:hypothetical protein
VPRPAFPTGLRQFQRQFADEAACREYLEACRWPDGFRCPRCGHRRAFPLRAWRRRECANCRYQVSLTAGTVFHRTRTPLTLWFWAAYLMTTDKRWDLGAAAAAPVGHPPVRDGLADPAQAPARHGQCGTGAVVRQNAILRNVYLFSSANSARLGPTRSKTGGRASGDTHARSYGSPPEAAAAARCSRRPVPDVRGRPTPERGQSTRSAATYFDRVGYRGRKSIGTDGQGVGEPHGGREARVSAER